MKYQCGHSFQPDKKKNEVILNGRFCTTFILHQMLSGLLPDRFMYSVDVS